MKTWHTKDLCTFVPLDLSTFAFFFSFYDDDNVFLHSNILIVFENVENNKRRQWQWWWQQRRYVRQHFMKRRWFIRINRQIECRCDYVIETLYKSIHRNRHYGWKCVFFVHIHLCSFFHMQTHSRIRWVDNTRDRKKYAIPWTRCEWIETQSVRTKNDRQEKEGRKWNKI